MTRVTFFTVRRQGPMLPYEMLGREDSLILAGHRKGHWSLPALQRIAARSGGELVQAYSIFRDSKGFMPSTKITITA